MKYLEIRITVSEAITDLLIAELTGIGFDSFYESENQLHAFIPEDQFRNQELNEILTRYDGASQTLDISELEDKNWNEEWENSFQPVIIEDICIIRASFHKSEKKFDVEIVIDPKMSFGTGHHETTALMAKSQLALDHKGKKVMDAGSGTGVLAILAEKLGASEVLAFDIEEWAFRNMVENIALNSCQKILAAQGTIAELQPPSDFDIVLANINRNILLEEMVKYKECLKENGILMISGFYTQDIPMLQEKANSLGLMKTGEEIKNNWVCLKFQKHKRN